MKEKVDFFKALADENRLKILEKLSCGELCACDIQDNLGLTQPTISHHMKALQQAGLVESEKRGKWSFYRISQAKLNQVINFLEQLNEDKARVICDCKLSPCNCDGERRC